MTTTTGSNRLTTANRTSATPGRMATTCCFKSKVFRGPVIAELSQKRLQSRGYGLCVPFVLMLSADPCEPL